MGAMDLPEMASKVNATAAAIRTLPRRSRGVNPIKKKMIWSVMGDIVAALGRGVAYQSIATAIAEKMEIKISGTTLKKYVDEYNAETEEKARSLSIKMAEAKRAQGGA